MNVADYLGELIEAAWAEDLEDVGGRLLELQDLVAGSNLGDADKRNLIQRLMAEGALWHAQRYTAEILPDIPDLTDRHEWVAEHLRILYGVVKADWLKEGF